MRVLSCCAASRLAERTAAAPSASVLLERSSANSWLSSSIWRLSFDKTVSLPVTSRARKNCASMKTESRKMMTRSMVDNASTNPGQ